MYYVSKRMEIAAVIALLFLMTANAVICTDTTGLLRFIASRVSLTLRVWLLTLSI